jgi:hygromycin-B 7''-O-kinase
MTEEISFEALRNSPQLSLNLVRGICERHHISPDCTRITRGSQLLFLSPDSRVIKIFSPQDSDFFRNEIVFLANLYDRSPIRTPRLIASGNAGRYPYIVMEKLEGSPMSHVWPELSGSERRNVIARLGRVVRAFHAMPAGPFDGGSFRWRSIIGHQRDALVANHRNCGLSEEWIAQLRDYVDGCPQDFLDPLPPVPLHTELMQEHILLERTGAEWTPAGLVDFEPSMVGHADYEFCAVGLFITRGDRNLFRLFLSSYGYHEQDLTDELSRRIMTLMLLHRYSNLKWFFTFLPEGMRFTRLRQLEEYWYGL